MAQRTQTVLIDDVDGSAADETVSFAIDGSNYEIELSDKNAAKLRDVLATYIAHGRRAGRTPKPAGRPAATTARADREQTQAIREWARSNGHEVSDRGRIPAAVLDAYNALH